MQETIASYVRAKLAGKADMHPEQIQRALFRNTLNVKITLGEVVSLMDAVRVPYAKKRIKNSRESFR